MMLVILGICWGGFIAALILGMRQQERRLEERTSPESEGE
jgi:hypothetical protein